MKKFLMILTLVATFGTSAFAAHVPTDNNSYVYCAKQGKFIPKGVVEKPTKKQESNKAS